MKTPPRIALIGFMGSGKSTVGSILARKLGYCFVDLDSEIEKEAGMKITDIFKKRGEPAFRGLETECLRTMADRTGIVLAAGGGTPVEEANKEFFQNSAATFFLKTPLETALSRAGVDGSRPLLSQGSAEVKRIFESRAETYLGLGRAVSTEGRTPLEIAEEIIEVLAATTKTRNPGAEA
jgi:shikimate kinase